MRHTISLFLCLFLLSGFAVGSTLAQQLEDGVEVGKGKGKDIGLAPEKNPKVDAGPTRSAQVAAMLKPVAIGKAEPHPTLVCAVVRTGSKDKELLAGLLKEGESQILGKTPMGELHVLERKQLKAQDELKKLAAEGKLPPVYSAYTVGDDVAFTDGSLAVKLKAGEDKKKLVAFMAANGLIPVTEIQAKAGEEAFTMYVLTFPDGGKHSNPFDCAKLLAGQDFIEISQPVWMVVSPEDEKDKD